jgi:hypothetical protein
MFRGLPPSLPTTKGEDMELDFIRPRGTWEGKIYPSGAFALWRTNDKKTIAFKEAFVSAGARILRGTDLADVQDLYGEEIIQGWWNASAEVGMPRLRPFPASPVNACPIDGWKNIQEQLGLSTPINSEKKRRGLGGLTSRGKNLVREAAIGLESRYGKSRLSFWTLTLPGLPQEDWRSVCKNWSKIVENLKKKLLYWLGKKGCPGHIVAVTEMQEKRWQREKVPAWHLHVVFVGRTLTGGWVITPKRADKLWREAVSVYTSSPASFQSSSKLQGVRKSVGRYLSKYLSKGTSVISQVEDVYPGCVPSSFYICTACLRSWVDNSTIKAEWVGPWLHQLLQDSMDEFEFAWAYTIETRPGQAIAVAWLGALPRGAIPKIDYSLLDA